MKKSDYLNQLHSQSLTDEYAILADIKTLIKESKSDREDREIRRGLRPKEKKDGKVETPYGLYDPNAPSEAELKYLKLRTQSIKNGGKKANFDVTGRGGKRDLTKPLICHSLGNDHSKKSTSTTRNSHNVSASTDELLRKYAAELRNAKPLPLTKDELRIKSSLMPHSTTTKIVDSYLNLDEMLTKQSTQRENNIQSSIATSSTSPSSQSEISTKSIQPSNSESRKYHEESNKDPPSSSTKNKDASRQDNGASDKYHSVPDLLNLDDGANHNYNQRLKHISAKRFRKKYPRYCSGIPPFTDEELYKIIPRSDWWICKFLELCYDEALLSFNTPQSHGKQKIYHGLNVGCLDAFPLLVQRVIGRYYSVLDMKKTISLEILYTIELMIERSEFARYKASYDKNKIKYDGGRSALFSKFLSEEYDVDILALFLFSREVIQQVAGHRLKDMAPTRIWVDQKVNGKNKVLRSMLEQNATKAKLHRPAVSLSVDRTGSRKHLLDNSHNGVLFSTEVEQQSAQHANIVNPISVTGRSASCGELKNTSSSYNPHSTSGIKAATSEGTKGSFVDQVRPFHASAEKVTPFLLPSKWYFIDDASLPEGPLVAFERSMLSYVCSLIVTECTIQDRHYLVDRVLDVTVADLLREGSKENKRDYVSQIPVYSFLRCICLEWKKLSAEDKLKLNDYSSQIYESLRSLNSIYDNNCEELKKADEKVRDAEAAMIGQNGLVLKLEKEFRRLEKKWNGNVATPAEVDRLGTVREELVREKINK